MSEANKSSIHELVRIGTERFLRLAPAGADHLTVVLKSHLLIEEQLNVIIAFGFQDGGPMKGERLGFGLAMKLAHAVTGELADPQLWPAIAALGRIRDAYGHQADPADMERRQAEFFSHAEAAAMWSGKSAGLRGAADFHGLCSLLFGQLFALASFMEQTSASRRKSFDDATCAYDVDRSLDLQAWGIARKRMQMRIDVSTQRGADGVRYFLTLRDSDGSALPPIVAAPRAYESDNAALIAATFELLRQLQARGMAGTHFDALPDVTDSHRGVDV